MELETDFVQDFNALNAPNPENKPTAYANLLDKILTAPESDLVEQNLQSYLTSLIGGDTGISGVSQPAESLSIISVRPLLDNFIAKVRETTLSNEIKITVCTTAVQLLRPRVASFIEQDTKFKELLADLHEAGDDYTSSARVLQSIDLDSTQRNVTDTNRAQIWVRISRCYLEEDDSTNASTYINRVKNVIHNVSDKTTKLMFQMSQARIYDSQRQFLDASTAYHNISYEPLVDEDDRLQTLSAAITCAILSPAGPLRSRTLSRLHGDDRAPQTPHYAILSKIYFNHILSPSEVSTFSATLPPHQLATTADGTTVLDRAILEHNLLGASRLYRNISLPALGGLLGVGAERAEQYAAQMIEQGRLAGHIDQIDALIFFEGEGTGKRLQDTAAAAAAGAGSATAAGQTAGQGAASELRRWDAGVQALAEEVEKVASAVQAAFPELCAEHVAF